MIYDVTVSGIRYNISGLNDNQTYMKYKSKVESIYKKKSRWGIRARSNCNWYEHDENFHFSEINKKKSL